MDRNATHCGSRHTNTPGISPSMMRVNSVGMRARLAREGSARSGDVLGGLDHHRAVVVGEAVEDARRDEPFARRLRLLARRELDEDVHLVRVVDVAQHLVAGGLPPGPGTVEI